MLVRLTSTAGQVSFAGRYKARKLMAKVAEVSIGAVSASFFAYRSQNNLANDSQNSCQNNLANKE